LTKIVVAFFPGLGIVFAFFPTTEDAFNMMKHLKALPMQRIIAAAVTVGMFYMVWLAIADLEKALAVAARV
jgi:hypothetical protein